MFGSLFWRGGYPSPTLLRVSVRMSLYYLCTFIYFITCRELDDFIKYVETESESWTLKTKLGLKSLNSQWATAAHIGAYCRPRLSAVEYATYMYLLKGEQVCWVSRNPVVLFEENFDIHETKWDCVLLFVEDEL